MTNNQNKNNQVINCDYLIIGAGIIGLSIARSIIDHAPNSEIIVIEKDNEAGAHSSGRNSGVLHAGFYYSANSLKAKFAREGNRQMTSYCTQNKLPINSSGKVVVAKSKNELETLNELKVRGDKNGVELYVVDEQELKNLEPVAKTFEKALYSPTTATVDPKLICTHIKESLEKKGVQFLFNEGFKYRIEKNSIYTHGNKTILSNKLINCAGLYADKIAQQFGFGKNYTIIPFKGIYLKDKEINKMGVTRNIYPVPNIKNPFLGVHFTTAVDGHIKLGPTSIPGFWRENYKGFSKFKISEFVSIMSWEAVLFLTNAFGFRTLAFEEIKKYNKKKYLNMAKPLVHDPEILSHLQEWTAPGIRAQLLNKKTKELVDDFVIEADNKSIHVLNAVSPAFTASFPFAEHVYQKYIKN